MSSLHARRVPGDIVEICLIAGLLGLAIWILFFRWSASQSVFEENWQGFAVLVAGVVVISGGLLVKRTGIVFLGICLALISEGVFLA